MQNIGVPYYVQDNGSCLFNAVSVDLSGTETLSTELRVRTCIEMVTKKDIYTSMPNANKLLWVSPNYITSTFDCAHARGWSSIWTFYALAEVIGTTIKSVYPPLNGGQDIYYKTLNLEATPRNNMHPNDMVTILWTRSTSHKGSMWVANHFSPIILHVDTCTSIDSTDLQSKSYDLDFPPLSSPSATPINIINTSNPQQVHIVDDTPDKHTDSAEGCHMEESDTDCDILNDENDESAQPVFASTPLPNGQTLTASQVFQAVISDNKTVVESIPDGYKDNVYFLLNNSVNISRCQNSKNSNFSDDCGAWDSHSGRTTKTHFIVSPDNSLKWTFLRDGVYCFQTKTNGKKTYTPYNPQPENIVTIHRYYSTLKRDNSYKRRVSWFETLPQHQLLNIHVAVIEYIGTSPRHGQPHGNAKNTTQEYIRTKPEVFDKIKTGIEQRQSSSEIYKNLVLTDSDNAPRDRHQIRNKKYNEKKKSSSSAIGNVADEIIEVLAMVNNDSFVQEVVYTHGNNKPPSIICYTKQQLDDLKQFLMTDQDCILGIDRTFNLGAVYVTNLVYKNKKVVSKETGDHPIFIGPMFLHWEGSFLSYHTFLSHVKARIQESVKCIDLRIGSDDESGLTKAIDSVFPNIERLLCTKHIKDNVSDHLRNKIGCNDQLRTNILNNLFGPNGLTSAIDPSDFHIKARDISRNYPEFDSYFQTRLKDRLFHYVNIPNWQLDYNRLWTNNNCESINHVFKKAVNWQPKSIPNLIQDLHDIVTVHFIDLKRSLYGSGNYELYGRYRKHLHSYQSWQTKTQEQQNNLLHRLLNDVTTKNTSIKSSYKNFEVPQPKRLAAKPYQRIRPRNCRTKPRF